MSFKKRIIAAAVLCAAIASMMIMSVSAYASDNNYYFAFEVRENQHWAHSDKAYNRGATSTATPWKVNFAASEEGKGTIMQFFLYEHSWPNYPKHSDYKNVTQGTGDRYFHAYDSASGEDLFLGARNNNYSPNKYDISGYWDEETAKHAFND